MTSDSTGVFQKDFKKLLAKRYPDLSYDLLRTAMAGAVLALHPVNLFELIPLLLEYLGYDDVMEFDSQEEANIWFRGITELWNQMGSHLHQEIPFQFSRWPKRMPKDVYKLVELSEARLDEIDLFLFGLAAGDTVIIDPDDFFERMDKMTDEEIQTELFWLPNRLEIVHRMISTLHSEIYQDNPSAARIVHETHSNLNEVMSSLHAPYIRTLKDYAKEQLEKLKARVFEDTKRDDSFAHTNNIIPIVRTSPKIGRNEPCPCGSGKKYKHCCLQ